MCLFINYNRICNKVSNLMKKGFTSEPVYNEKYSKTKIKSYDGSKKISVLTIMVFLQKVLIVFVCQ